tara:strand:- start:277 stop:531 length:255 start_codon:yes stop_codon:yes gene_type:complete
MVVLVAVPHVVQLHILVVLETLLTPIIHKFKDMMVVMAHQHMVLLILEVAVEVPGVLVVPTVQVCIHFQQIHLEDLQVDMVFSV